MLRVKSSVRFFCCCCCSLSHVQLFATPWTAARQASLSFTISWSLLRFMSIDSVTPSNHLILCCPLFLLSSIFPSIRVFSNESALHIRWPKYWPLQHQSFQEQASFNSMVAVTIHSDSGAQENKICHYFHCFPIYLPWSDGTRCHDLNFWMLSFKPTFSLSLFTFIKRLFSSSSRSAIRVGITCISEIVDISPCNLDSSLWVIQSSVLH